MKRPSRCRALMSRIGLFAAAISSIMLYQATAEPFIDVETLNETCQRKGGGVYAVAGVVCFIDEITAETAATFGRLAKKPDVDKLIINSSGGDTLAALKMADIIHENAMIVAVVGECFSSCANYVAPAASGLATARQALILMHGSPARSIAGYMRQEIHKRPEVMAAAKVCAASNSCNIDDEITNHTLEIMNGYGDYYEKFIIPESRQFAKMQVDEAYLTHYWSKLLAVETYASDECQPKGDFIVVVGFDYAREFNVAHRKSVWWPSREEVLDRAIAIAGDDATIVLDMELTPSYVPGLGVVAPGECLRPDLH